MFGLYVLFGVGRASLGTLDPLSRTKGQRVEDIAKAKEGRLNVNGFERIAEGNVPVSYIRWIVIALNRIYERLSEDTLSCLRVTGVTTHQVIHLNEHNLILKDKTTSLTRRS
jgi:hypothetical protein